MWQRKDSQPSRIHVPSHTELLGGRACPIGKYISKKFCLCVTSVGQWKVQRNGVCFPGWSSQFSDMLPIFLPHGEKDLGSWGGESPRNSCIRLKSSERPCVCVPSCSVVSHSVTPWTVAYRSPLPMGFPRQEYWGVLPFPPPGDLPNPGIEPVSLTSPALAGGFFNLCYHLGSPKPSHIDCHKLLYLSQLNNSIEVLFFRCTCVIFFFMCYNTL